MSALLEKTAAPQIPFSFTLSFHLRVACLSLTLLMICLVGCQVTSTRVVIGNAVIGILTMFAMLAPLPIYWHEKGRIALREATLIIAWELLVVLMVPVLVIIAARSHVPLQDSFLAHADQAFGVNVPAIAAWASHHWVGIALNKSYGFLYPLLGIATLVPALAGKVKHAREFLIANIVAFTVGFTAFALLPAVGPWYRDHTAFNFDQILCQRMLLSLRLPGTYLYVSQATNVVCFPSFHVIWAILCAAALWGFRPVRIPVALISGMIILSTMTTGWHYFSDVLGGIVVACLSMAIAKAYAI